MNMTDLLRQSQRTLAKLEQQEPPRAEMVEIPDLRTFVHQAWHVLEPATPFIGGRHIDAICEHLEAVSQGDITRLLITMPPRHGKSTLVSVLWPVWSWLAQSPSLRFLCASYAQSLSIRDNRSCRVLIQSQWFQHAMRYGTFFRLVDDQNMKSRFENNYRGYRLAVSTGSATTGEGGDILLIDDAHAIDDSTSDLNRTATLQWFDETWSSRLNSHLTGAMVVVGQRIHAADLSGHLIEQGGWEHLNLSAEYDPDTHSRTSLWADWRSESGEVLWPDRFPKEVLGRIKQQIGSHAYATLYQQRPMPQGGGQYRREWFKYYQDRGESYILDGLARSILKDRCTLIGTVDLAISSKQTADYTVFGLWAITPEKDILLVDILRGRFSNPEQLHLLEQLHRRYYPVYWKIERVAYQLAFLQQAIRAGIPCREYVPTRDKVSRAASASVWYENGKIYHRQGASWLADFETELLLFPRAAHDDQADLVPMVVDEVVLAGQEGIEPLDPGILEQLANYRGY